MPPVLAIPDGPIRRDRLALENAEEEEAEAEQHDEGDAAPEDAAHTLAGKDAQEEEEQRELEQRNVDKVVDLDNVKGLDEAVNLSNLDRPNVAPKPVGGEAVNVQVVAGDADHDGRQRDPVIYANARACDKDTEDEARNNKSSCDARERRRRGAENVAAVADGIAAANGRDVLGLWKERSELVGAGIMAASKSTPQRASKEQEAENSIPNASSTVQLVSVQVVVTSCRVLSRHMQVVLVTAQDDTPSEATRQSTAHDGSWEKTAPSTAAAAGEGSASAANSNGSGAVIFILDAVRW